MYYLLPPPQAFPVLSCITNIGYIYPSSLGISTTNIIDRIASRLAVGFEEHALPSERRPAAAVVRELSMAASQP